MKMREKSSSSALLRQVRAWQKAVLVQINQSIGDESNRLESLKVVRHLVLILFVVRMLEQRHSGLLYGALSGAFSGVFSGTSSNTLPDALSGANETSSRNRNLPQTEFLPDIPPNLPPKQFLYSRLVRLWRSLQPLFVGLPAPLELPPDLPLPDRLLRSMLRYLELHDLEFHNLEIAQDHANQNCADPNYTDPNYTDPNYTDPDQSSLLSASLLGQVYETLLMHPTVGKTPDRPSPRKAQGIYYTPAPIVEFMVEQTIDRLLNSAGTNDPPLAARGGRAGVEQLPRLLDPACGGGAFLLEAYQRLLDWQLQRLVNDLPANQEGLVQDKSGQWQLSWTMRQQILQHCIYGVDLDPEAVTIAQISLWLKLLEGTLPDHPLDKLPKLSANLQVGNALLDKDAVTAQNSLNWEQAFPAVIRSGGFDGVIGNPPYLDSEQMMHSCPTWRPYCATRYETAIGNWDLFCVFVEKALMLCRSGGMTSLIVPNKLASAPYAANTRSLLMRHRLLFIRDYAQVPLFAASVYPLVYGVQKALPPQTQVRYEVMDNLTDIRRSGWLSQNADSADSSGACWQFAESAVHARLIRQLQQFPTLGSIAQIYGAATVGEAYQLQPWLQECDRPTSGDFRFVNSGTIDRYAVEWGKKPTRYLGQSYQHPVLKSDRLHCLPARRQQQAQQPKIIVAGLSQQLECILDETGNLLPGKSTCIVLDLPEAIDWRYLLALLNSRLLTAYLRDCLGGNQLQGGYVRVGTAQLKQLPIALPNLTQAIDRQIYTEIIELVQTSISKGSIRHESIRHESIRHESTHHESAGKSLCLKNEHSQIDLEIDCRVAHLYQLTDEEAKIVTHTSSQQGQ